MNKRNKIYAIIPAYNESGKIGKVINKIKTVGIVDAIVTVDDGSSDTTYSEAESAGAIVICHEKNRGAGAAIRTGIKYGIENNYDIAAIVAGDDQHEPNELSRMLISIQRGDYDLVQGSRRMPGGKVINDRLFRKITTQMYSYLFSALTARRISDASNGFRAFRLTIFNEPDINIDQDWLNTYELEPYILYKAIKSKNIRMREVPITIFYHIDGRKFTKMKPFRDWWRLVKPMIYLSTGLRK